MTKNITFFLLLGLFVFAACKSDDTKNNVDKNKNKIVDHTEKFTPLPKKFQKIDSLPSTIDTITVSPVFSNHGFDSTIYYDLLIETHLCNPNYSDTTTDGSSPCSARFFRFYPYNHHRKIEDAFMLQVRAGINGYPYRRLLIFVRENGKLVLMNGIVGYLYKRIPQPNGFDDLIVGIIDDLGNNEFSRYDVLLRYKDGKYHFIEALGDLKGKFDDETLKKQATTAIYRRIKEKHLIY